MYRIRYEREAIKDLQNIGRFYGGAIKDSIKKTLPHRPNVVEGHKEYIVGLIPPWKDEISPFWQLSVGEHRVWYDVFKDENLVVIRAILHKPMHVTTKELL